MDFVDFMHISIDLGLLTGLVFVLYENKKLREKL